MFEKATRIKLRFKTSRGVVTTEDLWDLPLTVLDELAVGLNKKLKETTEESFIKAKSPDTSLIELRFNIVKHIIDVKLAEDEAKAKAAKVRQERSRLLDLIERKKTQELEGKSVEELYEELKKLEE